MGLHRYCLCADWVCFLICGCVCKVERNGKREVERDRESVSQGERERESVCVNEGKGAGRNRDLREGEGLVQLYNGLIPSLCGCVQTMWLGVTGILALSQLYLLLTHKQKHTGLNCFCQNIALIIIHRERAVTFIQANYLFLHQDWPLSTLRINASKPNDKILLIFLHTFLPYIKYNLIFLLTQSSNPILPSAEAWW